MQRDIYVLAVGALLLRTGAATWCNFYHDGLCRFDANGGTSFDCANPNNVYSTGKYVRCHYDVWSDDECKLYRDGELQFVIRPEDECMDVVDPPKHHYNLKYQWG